ncbi:MAG: M43 family zinc metalloprotease [Phycisphaerae bacterium]
MLRSSGGLWCAVALASAVTAYGQPDCGVALTEKDVQIVRDRQAAGLYGEADRAAGPGPSIVPLTIHVVRRSDGSGGVAEPLIADAIAECDVAFASLGLSFCQAGPTTHIDHDGYYDQIDTLAEANMLRLIDFVPNTINVYFVDALSIGAGPLCGLASFTFNSAQGVIIRNGCMTTAADRTTLAHEIGHYFDLFHTHETAFGEECADSSNCETAGDLVCDTPADPQLTRDMVSDECTYIGHASDPCNGAPYAPDPTNLMTYGRRECRNHFSSEQRGRALATIRNFRRGLLRVECPDPCAPYARCDVNCDGIISNFDIDAFVLALSDPAGYTLAYPWCARLCTTDVNGDAVVDNRDILAFTDCLANLAQP